MYYNNHNSTLVFIIYNDKNLYRKKIIHVYIYKLLNNRYFALFIIENHDGSYI